MRCTCTCSIEIACSSRSRRPKILHTTPPFQDRYNRCYSGQSSGRKRRHTLLHFHTAGTMGASHPVATQNAVLTFVASGQSRSPSGSGRTPEPFRSLVQDPGQEIHQLGKSPDWVVCKRRMPHACVLCALQRCTHHNPQVPKRYGGISSFAYVLRLCFFNGPLPFRTRSWNHVIPSWYSPTDYHVVVSMPRWN